MAAVVACGAVALPAAGAQAAAPRVTVTVIGPGGKVVRAPRGIFAGDARLRIDGRRCAVPSATPLAALAALRLPLRVTAGGSCTASSYFVTTIGRSKNRGRNGWSYKVGRRAGTVSAANPRGSFGNGRRLGSGDVVTWFWCVLGRRGCQRTLVASRVGARSVRVVAYDDRGRGIRVKRALVRVTDARGKRRSGRTNRRGRVSFGGLRGSWRISAKRGRYVPALPGGAR